jgi:hypothetical protein
MYIAFSSCMPYNLLISPTWSSNMARNNLTWIKGDITGDIYYDIFHLEAKDVQYLRLYLMVKGVAGAAGVKGLRVYGRGNKVLPFGRAAHFPQKRGGVQLALQQESDVILDEGF